MTNLEQLKQLVTFAELGTITKAAEELLISQPALTRSLQRLEEDLNIEIFDRHKNKTTLTEIGVYTVEQAKILLEHNDEFLSKINMFSEKNTTLFIGTVAPGPEIELHNYAINNNIKWKLDFSLLDENELLKGLKDETFNFIITENKIDEKGIFSISFIKEQLQLSVPKKHILSERESLRLSDLSGLSMLLLTEIGSWEKLIDNLDKTNFIRQEDSLAFNSLSIASDLPHFTTNITENYGEENPNRLNIPILDKEATKTFYISILNKNRNLLKFFNI